MGMLPSMVQSAQATVQGAMETGGRGSQTFTTDYTPLSNAFMKKAQLDMNIASLHSDNMNTRAQMLANLDIEKAQLQMQGAQLQLQNDQFQQQRRDEKEANEMSTFEQISGVLAGAASGAAAGGSASGGNKYAMMGGAVLGGVTAMGAGKDRRKQQSTLSNIGMVASAAKTIGEVNRQRKVDDTMDTLDKDWVKYSEILRTKPSDSPEYQDAQQKIEATITGYGKVHQMNGGSLHQGVAMQAEMRKQAYGANYVDPTDPKAVGNKEFKDTLVKGAADERIIKGDPQALQELETNLAMAYQKANPTAKITNSRMKTWMNSVGQKIVDENGVPAPQNLGDKYMEMKQNGFRGGGGGSSGGGGGSKAPPIDAMEQNPRTGNSTTRSSAGPRDSGPAPVRQVAGSGNVFGSSIGNKFGVTMDTNNEVQLQKTISDNSANTAKALADDPETLERATGVRAGDEGDAARRAKVGGWIKDKLGIGEANAIAPGETGGVPDDAPIKKDEPGFVESRVRGLQENFTYPFSKEVGPLREGGALDRAADKRELARNKKYEDAVADREARRAAANPEPPVEYADENERIFKEEPEKINKHFKIRERFGYDKAIAGEAASFKDTSVQIKEFEGAVDNFKSLDGEDKVSVGQMKTFKHFMEGEGDKAMKGSSTGGGAGGFNLSRSEFESTLSVEMEKAGEKGDLTNKQIDAMYEVYIRQAPLSRTLARSIGGEKGPMSNQDVIPFNNALFNSYDPSGRSGAGIMQGILYKNFTTRFGFNDEGVYEDASQKAAREVGVDYRKKSNTQSSKQMAPDDPVKFLDSPI